MTLNSFSAPSHPAPAQNLCPIFQESLLWDFFEERESQGAFSSVIDLDEDLIIQLLRTVGESMIALSAKEWIVAFNVIVHK